MPLELVKNVKDIAQAIPDTLRALKDMFPGLSQWSSSVAESHSTKKMMEDLAVIGEEGRKLCLPRSLVEQLQADAIRRHTKNENFNQVLVLAAGMDVDTRNTPEVSEDWKEEFRNNAEKAYDFDARATFASILAGEINKPGTYSKRMLNLLSEISKAEAASFVKVCRYAFNRAINTADGDLFYDPVILLEKDAKSTFNDGIVSLRDIAVCSSLGLVDSTLMSSIIFATDFPLRIIAGENVVTVFNQTGSNVSVPFHGCLFLPLGQEMSRLCEIGTAPNFKSIFNKKMEAYGLNCHWKEVTIC